MPDVPLIRPQDMGACTGRHLLENVPALCLPTLEKLGLMNALGLETSGMQANPGAVWGRAMLMHDGADTFFGHQEIMGTRPSKPFGEPISARIEKIHDLLTEHGYKVRYYPGKQNRMLIVNEAVTVADNMECDPGQAFNVSAALDLIDFQEEVKIGRLVRSVSVVPRVIVFGGRQVVLQNLLDAVEEKDGYMGVDAPASGVYRHDYHCIHLGYGVDADVQAPSILGRMGVPVYLLGKAADVIANPFGTSIPGVDTEQVLKKTGEILRQSPRAFVCCNVQETDLAGHQEDPARYIEVLKTADLGIAALLPLLDGDDILIVMADHGNDPYIGHPHHTREMVPLLVSAAHATPGTYLGIRKTLSDVGTTACNFFGADVPENGQSFLPLLTSAK